jgi:hypothetical protein
MGRGQNKGCGWGVIPGRLELVKFVEELSGSQYAGALLPGISLFDERRPPGWRRAQAICRAHGCAGTAEGWRTLMVNLGMDTPMAASGDALRTPVRQALAVRELDAPLTERAGDALDSAVGEPMPRLDRRAERYGGGLAVLEKVRPIGAWCWRTKRYVVVGYRRALVVR